MTDTTAPSFPTDTDAAGLNEPRRTSDTIDLTTAPNAPTATVGHKDEMFYNANPPAGTIGHDNVMTDQAGNVAAPQASPSAYPDYTFQDVGAKHIPSKPDALGKSDAKDELWMALPSKDDWESLGVGSRIERTEQGWEVVRKVTSGGGFAHGAGRSIKRAFQTIGATYDMSDGSRKLLDASGNPLPPEDAAK